MPGGEHLLGNPRKTFVENKKTRQAEWHLPSSAKGGEQEVFRATAEKTSATQGDIPPVEKCAPGGGQLLGNPRKTFAEADREGAFVGEPLGSYHI